MEALTKTWHSEIWVFSELLNDRFNSSCRSRAGQWTWTQCAVCSKGPLILTRGEMNRHNWSAKDCYGMDTDMLYLMINSYHLHHQVKFIPSLQQDGGNQEIWSAIQGKTGEKTIIIETRRQKLWNIKKQYLLIFYGQHKFNVEGSQVSNVFLRGSELGLESRAQFWASPWDGSHNLILCLSFYKSWSSSRFGRRVLLASSKKITLPSLQASKKILYNIHTKVLCQEYTIQNTDAWVMPKHVL